VLSLFFFSRYLLNLFVVFYRLSFRFGDMTGTRSFDVILRIFLSTLTTNRFHLPTFLATALIIPSYCRQFKI
jgi:hypothetical protein